LQRYSYQFIKSTKTFSWNSCCFVV
jgi:hypothetical protein